MIINTNKLANIMQINYGSNEKRKSYHYDYNIEKKTQVKLCEQRLAFYNENRNNPDFLRDVVNFYEGNVTYGKGSNGYFHMGNDGRGQAIPQTAVSRINAKTLPKLSANANKICLASKNYYSYKAIDGKEYVCAFNGNSICRARTEWVLGKGRENTSPECRGDMVSSMHILNSLINGSTGVLHMMDKAIVKKSLNNLGIVPGKFSVSVNGTEKSYYLTNEGKVYTEKYVKDVIDMYNRNTWLEGHSAGDVIMVFGKDYHIGEDGHIHVPTENSWVSDICTY